MESFSSGSSDSRWRTRHSGSDGEVCYATVSSAPPKRRAGRTKFCETRHPVYKGVRRRNAGRWVCEVREPGRKSRIWLGTFSTAEMAARAHDVAAIALRGRSACLNFADSAWRLPVPESSATRDIQLAAAKAAEAFRPRAEINRSLNTEEEEEEEEEADPAKPAAMGVSGVFDDSPFCLDAGHSFGIQGYLDLAAGLLIDPPLLWPPGDSDEESEGEVSLWSHSV